MLVPPIAPPIFNTCSKSGAKIVSIIMFKLMNILRAFNLNYFGFYFIF